MDEIIQPLDEMERGGGEGGGGGGGGRKVMLFPLVQV